MWNFDVCAIFPYPFLACALVAWSFFAFWFLGCWGYRTNRPFGTRLGRYPPHHSKVTKKWLANPKCFRVRQLARLPATTATSTCAPSASSPTPSDPRVATFSSSPSAGMPRAAPTSSTTAVRVSPGALELRNPGLPAKIFSAGVGGSAKCGERDGVERRASTDFVSDECAKLMEAYASHVPVCIPFLEIAHA